MSPQISVLENIKTIIYINLFLVTIECTFFNSVLFGDYVLPFKYLITNYKSNTHSETFFSLLLDFTKMQNNNNDFVLSKRNSKITKKYIKCSNIKIFTTTKGIVVLARQWSVPHHGFYSSKI